MSVLQTTLFSFLNLQICLAKYDSTVVPPENVIFMQDCDYTRLRFFSLLFLFFLGGGGDNFL